MNQLEMITEMLKNKNLKAKVCSCGEEIGVIGWSKNFQTLVWLESDLVWLESEFVFNIHFDDSNTTYSIIKDFYSTQMTDSIKILVCTLRTVIKSMDYNQKEKFIDTLRQELINLDNNGNLDEIINTAELEFLK
jgi:hypothetical protein